MTGRDRKQGRGGGAAEWPIVRLGDFLSIRHGWPFKSEYFVADDHSRPVVVAIGNFRYTGGFRFAETPTKCYSGPYPKEYELAAGEIVLVMTCQTAGGEILGIPATVPADGRGYLHNQRIGRVTEISHDLDCGYLYYLFLCPEFNRHLVTTASGTKILHTSPGRIENFKFRLPPPSEQTEIGAVLSALDAKINLSIESSKQLGAIARAIFKSWFVDFDPVRAKAEGRDPEGIDAATAALFPSEFEESELGEIPLGWTVNAIGDVSVANSKSLGKDYPHAEIEYVDISSVEPGRIANSTICNLCEAPSRAKRLVSDGDTIWSCVRPNRRSYALILEPSDNLVVSTGFVTLTATRVPFSLLYFTVTTSQFVDYLTSRADGAAYPAVRPDVFQTARVVIPPAPIAEKFHEIAESMLRAIAAKNRQIKTLSDLRDTLLPRLISGKLRVQEAEKLIETVI